MKGNTFTHRAEILLNFAEIERCFNIGSLVVKGKRIYWETYPYNLGRPERDAGNLELL